MPSNTVVSSHIWLIYIYLIKNLKKLKLICLVTLGTFQVLNDHMLDRTNTELYHHHRKFCWAMLLSEWCCWLYLQTWALFPPRTQATLTQAEKP